MAVPKYFLPAALATLKRPALEVVSVRSEDDGIDDAEATDFAAARGRRPSKLIVSDNNISNG